MSLKLDPGTRRTAAVLGALLVLILAASVVNAQTNLQATLAFRPLTPGEISKFKLPTGTETSAGLSTIGLGQPAYLEMQINVAVPPDDIVGVTWTLATRPSGSSAALADSPLTAAVPVFEPSDRVVTQVAGRQLLRPDVAGEYVVTATVNTKSNGSATESQTIIAATYVGINTCTGCHNGGPTMLDKVPMWSQTLHSHIFKDGITGVNGTSYGSNCFSCHTVGYDGSTKAANGGFDKVAAQLGWTPPTTLVAANWDALPDALKNVANIQCENCHGPGSMHAGSGGTPFAISVASNTGACSQCHDAPTHHIKTAEWNNSMHAITTRDPAGNSGCVGCHTSDGFIGRMNGLVVNTDFSAIGCSTCHEPHGQTAPSGAAHQLRSLQQVTLADGTLVKGAGEGLLCMNCHQSRQKASVYAATTKGSAHFGPHQCPQADMLQGTNGFTYGETIPTSAHQFMVQNTCVGCHMQTVATTDPGFLQVGGHTFKPSVTLAGSTTPIDLVAACQGCHGPDIASFDFPLMDYDGDGTIDGVQTEVQHLMDQLSALLPPAGKPKTALTIDATWTQPQLEAAYNWLFVNNDGSKGIHNTAYAVGLLKASIEHLKAGN